MKGIYSKLVYNKIIREKKLKEELLKKKAREDAYKAHQGVSLERQKMEWRKE